MNDIIKVWDNEEQLTVYYKDVSMLRMTKKYNEWLVTTLGDISYSRLREIMAELSHIDFPTK